MELEDIWSNYLPAGDWNVDLPVDRSGGLFGDIKSEGRHFCDDPLGLNLQDAVEHVRSESPSKDEDILGREWMESSDLGSLLEVLGNGHDKLLPLEASLNEYTFSTAPDVPFDDFLAKDGSHESFESSAGYSSLEHFLSKPLIYQASAESFDALMSSPSSPEQVAPVIKIEPVSTPECAQIASSLVDLFGDNTFQATVTDHNLIFGELDFSNIDTETSVVMYEDDSKFIALSADDVDSTLSSSNPSSPNTSQSSIIESSPELYKVILTSSVESTKRFAPYARPKPSKQAKASRTLAIELSVPDEDIHIIDVNDEHLSKKDRKKLQNKNAAIRYRMKKKEEAIGIKSEEQILEEKNLELKTKVDDLQREIKYMKNLMEDVCRAKGLSLK